MKTSQFILIFILMIVMFSLTMFLIRSNSELVTASKDGITNSTTFQPISTAAPTVTVTTPTPNRTDDKYELMWAAAGCYSDPTIAFGLDNWLIKKHDWALAVDSAASNDIQSYRNNSDIMKQTMCLGNSLKGQKIQLQNAGNLCLYQSKNMLGNESVFFGDCKELLPSMIWDPYNVDKNTQSFSMRNRLNRNLCLAVNPSSDNAVFASSCDNSKPGQKFKQNNTLVESVAQPGKCLQLQNAYGVNLQNCDRSNANQVTKFTPTD